MTTVDPALSALGWGPHTADRAAHFDRPGRVVRVEYGACVVATAAGELTADWTGRMSRDGGISHSPAVGDWVDVATVEDSGGPTGQSYVVVGVADRWSELVRDDPADSHLLQVLAANIDVIFVVASLAVSLNVRRLDRMLAMAWGSGARPVLLLTKVDLVDDVDEGLLAAIAGSATWIATSPVTGAGLEDLRRELGTGTGVFIGPSGVGKSSLVNELAGSELMAVAPVRDRDGKGRHTTTTRELLTLPGGGVVIDTPGIRGAQLWDPVVGIDRHFAELASLAEHCRFRDCAHGREPGCGVSAAVEAGEVTAERVERWLALHAEAAEWVEREVEHERSAARGRPPK